MTTSVHEPQYWLWVTRPEYYLDDEGNERVDLEPAAEVDSWWTCDKDTKAGDLILLYRATLKKDIRYLLVARSNAFPLENDPYVKENDLKWEYGCAYQVIHKFVPPITVADVRHNSVLQDWRAAKVDFNGKSFRIDAQQWIELNKIVLSKAGSAEVAETDKKIRTARQQLALERDYENYLASHLDLLCPFDFDLEVYNDPITGRGGQQFPAIGVGVIDLLLFDRQRNNFVVVELKRDEADRNALGQTLSYVGWVKRHLAQDSNVLGLVLSKSPDDKFASGLEVLLDTQVRYLSFQEIGIPDLTP